MALYERFGVLEYFLIRPDLEFIEKYVLSGGFFGRAQIFRGEEAFTMDALGFDLRAKDLFAG